MQNVRKEMELRRRAAAARERRSPNRTAAACRIRKQVILYRRVYYGEDLDAVLQEMNMEMADYDLMDRVFKRSDRKYLIRPTS